MKLLCGDKSIRPCDLCDGDLAVMLEDNGIDKIEGMVVQRYKGALIVLGLPSGSSYTTACELGTSKMRLKLLKEGDKLEV